MTRLLAALTTATLAAPSTAWACAVCGSDRGAQLRESILRDDPLAALAGVVSPFVVVLCAAAVARYGLPGRPGSAA